MVWAIAAEKYMGYIRAMNFMTKVGSNQFFSVHGLK
jgi:hypothetical protein